MKTDYLHWNDRKTLKRMFGDREAVCALARAFLGQYSATLETLQKSAGDDPRLSDEVHTLRSVFGIFYAEPAYSLVLSLDRELRAGHPVPEIARRKLIEELQGLARELEHFLTT